MKLGLVTYQMAIDWDIDTIIANCQAAGFAGVELRTTHAHGVEADLSDAKRCQIRQRFQDSGINAYGLGTAFEFHSPEPAQLQENLEGTKRAIQLAAELGMEGVKVRPNGIPKEVPEEKTIEQIGLSMRTVAEAAANAGICIWLEVHGQDSCRVDRMRRMIDIADHPHALLTYNCNPGETNAAGSCKECYQLLRDKIGCVHFHELWDDPHCYPYTELFGFLKNDGYGGWASYEGPGSEDPVLVMKCLRQMWEQMRSRG